MQLNSDCLLVLHPKMDENAIGSTDCIKLMTRFVSTNECSSQIWKTFGEIYDISYIHSFVILETAKKHMAQRQ